MNFSANLTWDERLVVMSALNQYIAWLRIAINKGAAEKLACDLMRADLRTAERLLAKLQSAAEAAPVTESAGAQ